MITRYLIPSPSTRLGDALSRSERSDKQPFQQVAEAIANLVKPLMSRPVETLGGGAFGRDKGDSHVSPLESFLGGIGSLLTPSRSGGSKPAAQRIPGGESLYAGRGMFHKGAPGAPDTYAFENSPAGIKFAAENGYSSIDIDMQITKDGVLVATHYAQPMKKDNFYDPLGKLDKDTKVKEMTFAEVSRLRNKDGKSQIYPVETMLSLLKEHGIAGDLEAKNDKRFATDEVMGSLAQLVRDSGIKANLKSIYHGSHSGEVLEMAQKYGFWVRVALPKEGQPEYRGYQE